MRQLVISQSITNRSIDGLNKYLSEISKEELINVDEEVALAQNIADGCTKSLERLVKANLRFVVSVAKQYQNQGLSLADLINEGNIGLIKAAYKFDASKGFKFISYAVWWIRQSILLALSDQSRLVRLPLNKVNLTSKIKKVSAKLEQEFERDPTAEEISKLVDADINDIDTVMNFKSRHLSMDASISGNDEESITVGEVLNLNDGATADLKVAHKQSLINDVQRYMNLLPLRHKEILSMCYGIGNSQELSLEEIGKIYGLTRERVRQIRDSSLAKIRAQDTSKILRSYLG